MPKIGDGVYRLQTSGLLSGSTLVPVGKQVRFPLGTSEVRCDPGHLTLNEQGKAARAEGGSKPLPRDKNRFA